MPFLKGHKGFRTKESYLKSGEKVRGEKHYAWKGDNAGLCATHEWVVKKLGKPSKCELCGTTKAKRFNWSNKYHTYKRKEEDWQRLCASCHELYDRHVLKKKSPTDIRRYLTCANCCKKFTAMSHRAKHCSRKCRHQFSNNKKYEKIIL